MHYPQHYKHPSNLHPQSCNHTWEWNLANYLNQKLRGMCGWPPTCLAESFHKRVIRPQKKGMQFTCYLFWRTHYQPCSVFVSGQNHQNQWLQWSNATHMKQLDPVKWSRNCLNIAADIGPLIIAAEHLIAYHLFNLKKPIWGKKVLHWYRAGAQRHRLKFKSPIFLGETIHQSSHELSKERERDRPTVGRSFIWRHLFLSIDWRARTQIAPWVSCPWSDRQARNVRAGSSTQSAWPWG